MEAGRGGAGTVANLPGSPTVHASLVDREVESVGRVGADHPAAAAESVFARQHWMPDPLILMDELICPRCETDEHLTGERGEHVIHITCTACALSWDRDPSPRCEHCGDTDVHTISEPVIEKARGTQLSIVGVTTIYLCHPCYKQHYLTRDYRHIRPGENPAE